MRVLVGGGRNFEDAAKVHQELVRLHWQKPISVLIHGSVTGIGIAAEAWARCSGTHVVRYPPNWKLYGKKAEGLRDAFMIEDSRPDLVLAFPGGRHTADLIQKAIDAKIVVLTVQAGSAWIADTETGQPQTITATAGPQPIHLAELGSGQIAPT